MILMTQPPSIRPATPDDVDQALAIFKNLTVPQRELCLVAKEENGTIIGIIRGVESKDKKSVIVTPARLASDADPKLTEQMQNLLNGRLMLLEMPEMRVVSDKEFAKIFKETSKPKAKAKAKPKAKTKKSEADEALDSEPDADAGEDLTEEELAEREQMRKEQKRMADTARKSASSKNDLVMDTTTLQDQDYLARIAQFLPAYPLRPVEIAGSLSAEQLDGLLNGQALHVPHPGTSGITVEAHDLDEHDRADLSSGQSIEVLVGTIRVTLQPPASAVDQ